MTSHVVTGLTEKLAEITGQIEHHKAVVADLTAQRDHVVATIALFDPGYSIAKVKPKRVVERSQWFEPSEGTRLVLGEFRKAAGQPLTSQQIVEGLTTAKGLVFIQLAEQKRFAASVENIIQRLKQKKSIHSLGRLNGERSVSWGLGAVPQAASGIA